VLKPKPVNRACSVCQSLITAQVRRIGRQAHSKKQANRPTDGRTKLTNGRGRGKTLSLTEATQPHLTASLHPPSQPQLQWLTFIRRHYSTAIIVAQLDHVPCRLMYVNSWRHLVNSVHPTPAAAAGRDDNDVMTTTRTHTQPDRQPHMRSRSGITHSSSEHTDQ